MYFELSCGVHEQERVWCVFLFVGCLGDSKNTPVAIYQSHVHTLLDTHHAQFEGWLYSLGQ